MNPDAKKVSGIPKKSKKADLRRNTNPILAIVLCGLVWGSNELLNFTQYDYSTSNTTGVTNTSVHNTPNSGDTGEDGQINILSLDVEQIENLANTIAGRNAIWYGYKGDPNDHQAVQRHFQEQFAKFINSGIISVQPEWSGKSVAFAYAVSDTGVITFVGKIPGGSIKDNYVYIEVKQGIDGKMQVIPAQDEAGEPIIMLYYIKVRFAVT